MRALIADRGECLRLGSEPIGPRYASMVALRPKALYVSQPRKNQRGNRRTSARILSRPIGRVRPTALEVGGVYASRGQVARCAGAGWLERVGSDCWRWWIRGYSLLTPTYMG